MIAIDVSKSLSVIDIGLYKEPILKLSLAGGSKSFESAEDTVRRSVSLSG